MYRATFYDIFISNICKFVKVTIKQESYDQILATYSLFRNINTDRKEAEDGNYPFIAAIGFKDPKSGAITYDCGGTLINRQYVLTAGTNLIKLF
jgi:secreted trypsin-like serine protease